MNAVFSFMSEPYLLNQNRVHGNISNRFFYYAWSLSVHLAAQHYKKVILITDDFGKHLLINKLQLPFTDVSTSLNVINGIGKNFWALGKMIAYKEQTEPFLHIDYDVFLFDRIDFTGTITQSIEPFEVHSLYNFITDKMKAAGYSSKVFDATYKKMNHAFNAGILGSDDIDFIQKYYAEAANIVNFAKLNRSKFINSLDVYNQGLFSCIFEQYAIAAAAKYYEKEIKVHLKNMKEGSAKNYVHVHGAKNNIEVMNRVKQRLQNDFPAAFNAADLAIHKLSKFSSKFIQGLQ